MKGYEQITLQAITADSRPLNIYTESPLPSKGHCYREYSSTICQTYFIMIYQCVKEVIYTLDYIRNEFTYK